MSKFIFVLLLTVGIGIHQSCGVEVKVNDKDGKLCLYANLMVNFSISYETTDKMMAVVDIPLPSNVISTESVCETNSSSLKLDFETGHSWMMTFSTDGKAYEADSIVFSYNLNDSAVFPNSSSKETVKVTVKPSITGVTTDTSYSCRSSEVITDKSVNQTLFDVLIQAFITNGNLSMNSTICTADTPTPTAAPTKSPTSAPIVPTTPSPALPDPPTGNYSIVADNSTCLLANFGLRLGFKQGDKYKEMNLDANHVKFTGDCGVNSSNLTLVTDDMTVMMTFTNDTKMFRLHALMASVKTSSGDLFTDGNTNLSLWQASVGNSYMCNKKQNDTISEKLFVFTFKLQVQPFGVKKGVYSTAQECSLDDTSILIPIIVGAALAALILIVVIAYVIGRRKTYVGYQTL